MIINFNLPKALVILIILPFNYISQINKSSFPSEVIKKNKIYSYKVFEINDTIQTPVLTVQFDSAHREINYINFESTLYHSEYNKYGQITSKKFFPFGSSTPFEENHYIYNESGQLIEENVINLYDDNSTIKHIYVNDLLANSFLDDELLYSFEYDKSANKTKEIEYYNGNIARYRLNTYNSKGKIIFCYSLSAIGDTTNYIKYSYSDQDLIQTESCYNEKHELSQLYKYEYYKNKTIKYHEAFTEIKDNDLKKSIYNKYIYEYQFDTPKSDSKDFLSKNLPILINQNGESKTMSNNEEITLEKNSFSIIFYNKKLSYREMKFHSAKLFATSDENIFKKITTNKKTSDIECLAPGSGMTGGSGPFDAIYLKCAYHQLIYENQYSTKLKLLSEENGIYKLQFDVHKVSENKETFNIENYNKDKLFLVFYIDRNLDGIIDNEELTKITINFK